MYNTIPRLLVTLGFAVLTTPSVAGAQQFFEGDQVQVVVGSVAKGLEIELGQDCAVTDNSKGVVAAVGIDFWAMQTPDTLVVEFNTSSDSEATEPCVLLFTPHGKAFLDSRIKIAKVTEKVPMTQGQTEPFTSE